MNENENKKANPERPRRKRYQQVEGMEGCLLTPKKQALLLHIARCRLLSLPQLAALVDLTPKATRNHMRGLFDGGLVSVVGVPRSLLASATDPNDISLLYGSAPNIYLPTKDGLRQLYTLGKISREERDRPIPVYSPRNALFLAHELEVRDVRVFLERARRKHGGEVLAWRDGNETVFDLSYLRVSGVRAARPDAYFAYRMPGSSNTLVGLVEVDRGTERGDGHWKEKIAQYRTLLTAGQQILMAQTGFKHARVIVVVPSATRRDWLIRLIEKELPAPELRRPFWIVVRESLESATSFLDPIWHHAYGTAGTPLTPLLSPEALEPGT
jgi:hypothetical protein